MAMRYGLLVIIFLGFLLFAVLLVALYALYLIVRRMWRNEEPAQLAKRGPGVPSEPEYRPVQTTEAPPPAPEAMAEPPFSQRAPEGVDVAVQPPPAPAAMAGVEAAADDDLTRLEGIGPRIAAVLHGAGIRSFATLAQTEPSRLREVLEAADPRLLRLADPSAWPERAAQIGAVQVRQPATPNDLTFLEGIGPKIASLLRAAGVTTFAQLAETAPARLLEILEAADPRLARLADPTTWPEQAALAAAGRWADLEALTDKLKGGRRV
ncbi:MAG: DUF4332 domain-containing protein [Chloroflexi bacterium]|nr:DUF4332 domain-containing protein [Chloroflexota bacterium]